MTFATNQDFERALVERPSPDEAPSAFRLWGYGEILADGGPSDEDDTIVFHFTERSASLLADEQERRGRTYAFDFDHLSLKADRPPTAGRAAGYFRLGVRKDEAGKPELWAVDIEWTPDVKAGLEQKPPLWRYFSPAFQWDRGTKEVVSFINCAICINPRTHNLPALACFATSTEDQSMDIKAMLEILAGLIEGAADGPEKDKFLILKAGLEKQAEGAGADASPGDGSPSSADVSATAEGGEEEAPASKKDESSDAKGDGDKEKKEGEAMSLSKRLDSLELDAILAKRPDINAKTREVLSAMPLDQARKLVATLSTPLAPLKSSATVGGETKDATGEKKVSAEQLAAELAVDTALGLRRTEVETLGFSEKLNIEGKYSLTTMTPSQARAFASKGK